MDFKLALAGIHPDWVPIFRDAAPPLAEALSAVSKSHAEGKRIVPPLPLIFEAFRYVGPRQVVTVVVAQDPYHTVVEPSGEAQAQGLCFSCHPAVTKAQPSLNNIRDAVVADVSAQMRARGRSAGLGQEPVAPTAMTDEKLAELAKDLEEAGARSHLHDLRFWASQGVLLLNRALTTIAGKAKEHHSAWKPFTLAILQSLAKLRAATVATRPLTFMLWGDEARGLSMFLRTALGGKHVLEWSHPSPMADNKRPLEKKMRNCQHFWKTTTLLEAASIRSPVWLELPTLAACDGGCTGNGSKDARAGYGLTILTGPLRGLKVYGPVRPHLYRWVDENEPLQGFHADETTSQPPTNNRGEYLAACYLMLSLARAGLTQPVEIVSDSQLFIRTMTEWLPNWRQKSIAHTKKNYDLVVLAEKLLQKLQSRAAVTLTHRKSHEAEPERYPMTVHSRREWSLWKANDVADGLATLGIGATEFTINEPFWIPH